MSKDILLVSDIHLGHSKDSSIYHNVALNLFQEIDYTCIKRDIKDIFILGDLFTNRTSLNLKTMEIAYLIGKILNKYNTKILTGNHDLFYKNQPKPHSLQIFDKGYDNITIVDEQPLVDDNCTLVPWLFQDYKKIKTPYVFGHFEIINFDMNDDMKCSDGTPSKQFSKFQKVFSGHFHKPSRKENIVYIGSPYQFTYADLHSVRGYTIFNTETGNDEHIPFTNYPLFKLFAYDKIKKNEIKGNIVKIVFTEEISTKKITDLIENIRSYEPMILYTDFNFL